MKFFTGSLSLSADFLISFDARGKQIGSGSAGSVSNKDLLEQGGGLMEEA